MQKQTYSCGNTPQPGDVVHLLSIPSEPHIWPTISGLEIGKEYVVDSFCERIKIKGTSYYHAPSRFRLLRRAGEQPQPDILQAAIKLRLHLEAEKDIPKTNWKKGDRLELENNVFDKNTGIAFIPLDLGWKVNGVEILESDPQPDYAKLLEEKEREIERLKEQVNDLKMDAAAHEYNEIERLRYQEEYERQLLEEKDEAIRELVADLEQLNYWVNSENTKNLITKYKQP